MMDDKNIHIESDALTNDLVQTTNLLKNKKRIIAFILALIGVALIIFSAVKIYEKWNDNLEFEIETAVRKMSLSDVFGNNNIPDDKNILLEEEIEDLSDDPYWHSVRYFGDDICKVSVGNLRDMIIFADDNVLNNVFTTTMERPIYLRSPSFEIEYNVKSKTIESVTSTAYGVEMNDKNYQYFYKFDKEAILKMFLNEEVPNIEEYVLDKQKIQK